MASVMLPGQSSSVTTLRPTKLLDLPNELLSRILDFLIPRRFICPERTRHSPRDGSIGLTCMRLFKLVRHRLLKLDFVHPRSLTDITRIPTHLSRNIELYTRIASPYAEVLRLPTDFEPKDPAFTSLGWCPHLRELCVTINEDPLPIDMDQYFIGHKKLEVLTLHTPGTQVLFSLAYASLKIRKLTLVTLQCSEGMLRALDHLLSTMNTLESLTISLYAGRFKPHYPPRLKRHLAGPKDRLYLLEPFMHSFSQILRSNHNKLTALRKVSLWSGSRSASFLQSPDDIETLNLADEVRYFAFYVDNARELAFDNPPDLKLHLLRLRMFNRGESDLGGFMRGLVDASTEVILNLYHITVRYPALVDQSNPPLPVISEIMFDDLEEWTYYSSDEEEEPVEAEDTEFYRKYSMLQECAEMKLESLVIASVDSTKMLLQTSEQLLSGFLQQNRLKSVMFHYKTQTKSQLGMVVKLLQQLSPFAPTIREIALPTHFMSNSEVINTKDLASLTFATTLRVLRLFNRTRAPPRFADFKPYEDVHIPMQGSDIPSSFGGMLAERLPEFLEKLRQAFPNLTHLFMDPASARNVFDENTFHWIEQVVKEYEQRSGVDASSLRTELQTWIGAPDDCGYSSSGS